MKAKFIVNCTAMYHTELEIPKEIVNDKEAILEYIHNNLDQCIIEDLEWVGDLEPEAAVTEEDIVDIY